MCKGGFVMNRSDRENYEEEKRQAYLEEEERKRSYYNERDYRREQELYEENKKNKHSQTE